MDNHWQIRKAVPRDAAGLAACMELAYAAYQDRFQGMRLPPMDVDYRREIENYPTWVVDSEPGIVGGLIMSFEDYKASLANIAVTPDCQGRGIGGALMKFAESEASAKGYSELQLATHVLLSENISLYRHLGWMETGRDETRVFMHKILLPDG